MTDITIKLCDMLDNPWTNKTFLWIKEGNKEKQIAISFINETISTNIFVWQDIYFRHLDELRNVLCYFAKYIVQAIL